MLSKDEKSPTRTHGHVEKSGLIESVFYLTNEELVKIIKGSGYRWTREGYVNLQGGTDPAANEYHSIVLGGKQITKLVIVSLKPKLAAQIRHLDLSFNPELESVEPKEELEKLTNLKFLEFKYSQRKEVPLWVNSLPVLETLLMGGNQISVLPSWVTEKLGMKVVSLFMNELETIESYGEIEELNVGSNKTLRNIPPLQPTSKLKDLEAERCDLQELPENIFSGELVKCVVNHNPNLGNVKLPSAPRDTSLRVLSATFCGLVEIPVGLIRPEMFVKV